MAKYHNISTSTLRSLWDNWAISFGLAAAAGLLSLAVSKTLFPLVMIAMAGVLSFRQRTLTSGEKQRACHVVVWAMTLVLFWSGIAMLFINLLYAEWFFGNLISIEPYNPKLPYITCLVVFPIATLISGVFLLMGRKMSVCRQCQAQYGYYPTDGTVGRLYYKEVRYQMALLFTLSAFISVIAWLYYFLFYINVNFNSPDKYFFIGMPIAIYVLSDIFLAVRYMAMSDQMQEKSSAPMMQPMMTMIRYLVLRGDTLLLAPTTDNRFDTPAKMTIPRRDNLSPEEAAKDFETISGFTDFETKYLYTEQGFVNGANKIHYAAFVPEETAGTAKLTGEWVTLDVIDRLLKAHCLDPRLVSEINRIYNMTMAWKTYDTHGNRLYPIKHYRPTFRLRDFKKWNVDYNDLHWLDIATNNADRRFFRLRKFWRKNFHH